MSNLIIEAAARALTRWDGYDAEQWPAACHQAEAVLAAVTPLIEAAYVRSRATIHVAAIRNVTLEEAAAVAESYTFYGEVIATDIRALKEQP